MDKAIDNIRRLGTSFVEFEEAFANPDACLDHIFKSRFGNNVCPGCGQPTSFLRIRNTNRYIPRCCYDHPVFPLRNTIFSATRLALTDWFRAILYFTNSSNGVSPNFIKQQIGISTKAAIRMCQLIREHMTAIDSATMLGCDGKVVYVSETTIKSVSRAKQKNGVRFRILLATDCSETLAIPVATGKYVNSRDHLLDRVCARSVIVTQTAELHSKLVNYKKLSRIKGRPIAVTSQPYLDPFCRLSVFGIALKRFILRSHYWVSEQHLASYIGHFTFLYRRRMRGSEAFWDAVSTFPRCEARR